MTKIYINTRQYGSVETIDELSRSDFESRKAFNDEVHRLLDEYRLAGMAAYASSRCTKAWRERA
jgi:hypothetical protein